jgi:hypothetical protein
MMADLFTLTYTPPPSPLLADNTHSTEAKFLVPDWGGKSRLWHRVADSGGRDSEKKNQLERRRSSVSQENYLLSGFVTLSPSKYQGFCDFSLQNNHFYIDKVIVWL